jgi:hypothetical protein
MILAKDYFPDDAMAELWEALGVSPKRTATIKRDMAGSCVVLRPASDRRMSWPEQVRSALQESRRRRAR